MTSVEERMKILKMIEEGKISAEEGAKLLAALRDGGRRGPGVPTPPRPPGAPGARWLRVRVTDTNTGRSKASVQIPLALVDAGMKIGAHFAPEVEGVDMSNVMEAIRSGVTGKIIDVIDEEDGEHVEIFVE
ncbi:MAG: SHOCT-like domain-containing protein [Chloroflexota bacterium]